MDGSILTTTKKLLGIAEDYTAFDLDIILHINSVFTILTQMGVGAEKGFSILDDTTKWSDFIPEGEMMEAVKSYMALKVRMMFDPPTSSTTMQALSNMISELEWRLNVLCDKTGYNSITESDCVGRQLGVLCSSGGPSQADLDLKRYVAPAFILDEFVRINNDKE